MGFITAQDETELAVLAMQAALGGRQPRASWRPLAMGQAVRRGVGPGRVSGGDKRQGEW